jgi:pentapeptide MXKDX repeat protein
MMVSEFVYLFAKIDFWCLFNLNFVFQKARRCVLLSKSKMSNDKMSNDKMLNDKMSNDKMFNDNMPNDKMFNDKMSTDKMLHEHVVPSHPHNSNVPMYVCIFIQTYVCRPI